MKQKIITLILLLFFALPASAWVKGIYISQPTLENTRKMNYLIHQAKDLNIDTFVIDFNRWSRRYAENIQLVKNNKITYVARIVVFPGGAKAWQVYSISYLDKVYKRIEQAINAGADQIQLDYIRFDTGRRASSQNSRDIHAVIQWFKRKVDAQGVPLQIDVFGGAAHKEEVHIGQNVKLFAKDIDVLCPMVYPSHYKPYRYHSTHPYETIYNSLRALKQQFDYQIPFKVYAYIEVRNHRYRQSRVAQRRYISAQIRAVQDSGVDGWYAWSPNNKYEILFETLREFKLR